MKNSIKNIITGGIIILIFILGYFRELFFLILNAVINQVPFPFNRAYVEPPEFLYNYSPEVLIQLKWFLTLFFSLIFLICTLGLVNFFFKSKSYNRLTMLIYITIIIAAFLIYLIGITLNLEDEFYTVSRFFIGLVQYPLFSLILFSIFYFNTHINNN